MSAFLHLYGSDAVFIIGQAPYDGSELIPQDDTITHMGRYPFDPGATMLHGGDFRICVSRGGAFAKGDASLVNLDDSGYAINYKSVGLLDSCTAKDCFANRRFYCWAPHMDLML